MRKVQIYIENQKIDLFEDENIEITSSIQNISDISKVFTDFSQSFTIPATKSNNAIFDHYYNSDVDGTYDAQVRVAARIEINHDKFREGKIQLEGAEIVKGKAESYTIAFYGDVVTLKDLFGDDKLRDLDYSTLQSAYTGANIQTTITSTSELDVRYPLISSSRVWTYGDTPATTDIGDSSSPIVYTELFPALKDTKIFSLIESKYGVTFSGSFLADANYRFSRAYTYWKNSESVNFLTEPIDIDFTGGTVLDSNVANIDYIDTATITPPANWASWTTEYHKLKIVITPTVYTQYYVDVYVDGTLAGTQVSSSNVNQFYIYGGNGLGLQNIAGLNKDVTFKLRSDAAMTFTADIQWEFRAHYQNTTGGTSFYTETETYSTASPLTTLVYFDFAGTAPDMKVSEWFSGTIKEFNGTVYPTSTALTYEVEPLNDWYKSGEQIDITPYVDIDKIKVSRPKLYNELSFSFEDSKSFLNEAYKDIYNKGYGDLKQVLGYDGGKYEIKLPFENLLFQAFTGTDLQVGYCLTRSPDYKPYVPKVIKLYLQDNKTGESFYFDDGTGASELTNYMPFGQDVTYNTAPYSSNWGNEQSSLLEVGVENSRYQTYYQKYLVNLFNTKTRVVDLKCILPLSMLTSLTLDDKLLIRDKWYRINTMKTNLTSGVVDLQLISDWTKGVIQEQLPSISCDAASLIYNVQPIRPTNDATADSGLGNGGGYVSVSEVLEGVPSTFVTSAPALGTTYTSAQIFYLTVAANSTGSPRTNTIQLDYYNSQGVLQYTDYIVVYQLGCESFLLGEADSVGILMTELLENILLE